MISKCNLIVRGLALASAFLLQACSPSMYSGYVTAQPEAKKVVDEGGYSDDAMAQIAIVQNPDLPANSPNKGKISPKAVTKIQQYAISCQYQIDPQLAGGAQSVINGALPNGGAGALGTGLGAHAAFAGAKFREYATYGGVASLFLGIPYGATSGSYSMASAKGDCTRQFWEDIVKTDPDFQGTHVVIVYAGKRWGDSRPPAMLNRDTVAKPQVLRTDRK